MIKAALAEYVGIKRRLELYVSQSRGFFMDDYAHHPREIAATLSSVREVVGDRHITAIFQPHLYTRTRDLHEGFAEALSRADRVVLLPIYPAREEPIEGVSSQMIARLVEGCEVVAKESIAEYIASVESDVVITFGAGDIELCAQSIAQVVSDKLR